MCAVTLQNTNCHRPFFCTLQRKVPGTQMRSNEESKKMENKNIHF